MVTELELNTFATKNVKLPLFTGYIARGLALHMLKAVNPSVSLNLHEPNAIKPYSVTPLYFRSLKKFVDGYDMDISSPCIFKIRLLDDSITKNILNYFTSYENIMILDTMFKIDSVRTNSEDFTKVYNNNHFRISFVTPTHLSKIGSKFDTVFPEPLSIFPNLMRIWDSCMPDKFGKENHIKYKVWIENNLTVSAYDLHTSTVFGKSMKIGFTGWSNYRMADDKKDSEFHLVTNKLARFAEYSNIGMERTAGFGVTRYYS